MCPACCAERAPSLHDLVNRWLERTPFLQSGSFSFWSHYRKAVDNMLEVDRTTIECGAAPHKRHSARATPALSLTQSTALGCRKNPNLDEEAKTKHLDGLANTREHFEAVFDEVRWPHTYPRLHGTTRSHPHTYVHVCTHTHIPIPSLTYTSPLLIVPDRRTSTRSDGPRGTTDSPTR